MRRVRVLDPEPRRRPDPRHPTGYGPAFSATDQPVAVPTDGRDREGDRVPTGDQRRRRAPTNYSFRCRRQKKTTFFFSRKYARAFAHFKPFEPLSPLYYVTANSAFYHSLSKFVLLTEYFKTREKLKVASMTFEVSKTETRKQIIFSN